MLLKKVNDYFMICFMLILLAGVSACKGKEQDKQTPALQSEETVNKSVSKKAGPDLANAVIKVSFFYSDSYRCASCRKIEAYTKKAVMENFADELKSGRLEFSLVDIDRNENKYAVEKYKLFTKSVIVAEFSGDEELRWHNLDKVWRLLNDEESFKAYIVKEIKAYL